MEVVENQQLDEELTGERKKRALEKGGYLANRVASGKEGQPVERRDPSGNVTMRTTTNAPTKRGGEEDKGERKTDWYGYEADRGSGNKAARRAAALKKEEVDIYDIILSHLLDEGYADTQESAEAIMVNMSEEWRESIVEAKKWIQQAIKKPGAFTKKAKAHKMTPSQFKSEVQAHPEKYPTKTERQANLMGTLGKLNK
jgi:hypothetical protein